MITNFQINKIQTQAYRDIQFNNISINHELNLKNPNILLQKMPFGDKNVLRIDYQLSVNYLNPNIGYMIFEGASDYFSEDDFVMIKENWSDPNNIIINKIKTEFAGTIFTNIIPFAMLMSSRMNLPPVVPIPQINFDGKKKEKQEPQSYIG